MRLLLVTGTTGAGASSPAAATAVQAARRGVKTTLLSGGEALADAEGLRPDEPGLSVVRADGPELDLTAVADQLGMDPVPSLLLAAVPGLTEVIRWLALPERATRGPADLVVADLGSVDAAARLLAAPCGVRACLDHLLPVGRRVQRAMSLPADPVTESVDRLRGRLAAVQNLLEAPETSVRLVVEPDARGRTRGRRWLPWLSAYGCRVEWVEWVDLLDDEPRPPADADALLALPVVPQPRRLEPDGSGYLLSLRLPLARRAEVELHLIDDDLVLDASAGQAAPAVIALPSVLRRCRVVGAALVGAEGADAELQVRFEPDPDLWPTS